MSFGIAMCVNRSLARSHQMLQMLQKVLAYVMFLDKSRTSFKIIGINKMD